MIIIAMNNSDDTYREIVSIEVRESENNEQDPSLSSDLESQSSFEILTSEDFSSSSSSEELEELKLVSKESYKKSTMSGSCNFMNWVSATNRRASSVSPSAKPDNDKDTKDSTNEATDSTMLSVASSLTGIRRASSSDIIAKSSMDDNRSSADSAYLRINYPENPLEPLDSPRDDPYFAFEDEEFVCSMLEEEVKRLEDSVADLERKRFAPDVPRTLVDSIIQHRRELRELQVQLYMQHLELKEGKYEDCARVTDDSSSPSDDSLLRASGAIDVHKVDPKVDKCQFPPVHRPGKFGSNLKPGQENTADILNAVPPSGQMQHRQYLNKASGGASKREHRSSYRQQQHKCLEKHIDQLDKHQIQDCPQIDVPSCQLNEQVVRPTKDSHTRSSPVRPRHFHNDFKPDQVIMTQDSSSASSSMSPH